MKKKCLLIPYLFLLVVFMISLIQYSCKTKESHFKRMPPEKVSAQFFEFFNNYQYDKAKLLASENTVKIITFVQNLASLGGGGKIVQTDSKKELISCSIDGKTAVCLYKTHAGGEEKVYLIKEKGRWLVDLRPEIKNKNP